jgi:hypothetical protein
LALAITEYVGQTYATVAAATQADRHALVDLRVFQRDPDTPWRDMKFSGTYTGTAPTGIEAQIIRASDSVVITAWTRCSDEVIAANAWEGVLPAVPQTGVKYKVQIRDLAVPGTVVTSTAEFWVGICIWMEGQSNADNMFQNTINDTPNANTRWFNQSAFGTKGWISAAGTDACPMLNDINDTAGVAVAIGNWTVPAAGVGNFIGSNWTSTGLPLFQAFGGECEFFLWHQGEANTAQYERPYYDDQLNTKHGLICDASGRELRQCPMLLGTINADNVNGGLPFRPEQNLGHIWVMTQTINAQHRYPHIHLSHTCAGEDLITSDGLHYTDDAQRRNAKRYGRTILSMLGLEQGKPTPEITHAVTVDATTTDVYIRHGTGTDFSGKASASNFTGFEVSGSHGAIWEDATANRVDATTIRLTHSSLATTAARKVRYMWGWDADITNCVQDNSDYAAFLVPTAGVHGITPRPLYQSATPTFHEYRIPDAGALNGQASHTYSDVRIGKWTRTKKLLVIGIRGQTDREDPTVTVTPNRGRPVTATIVAISPDTSVRTQYWAIAELSGFATEVTFEISWSGNSNWPAVGVWTLASQDLVSITPTSAYTREAAAATATATLNVPANAIVLGMTDGTYTTGSGTAAIDISGDGDYGVCRDMTHDASTSDARVWFQGTAPEDTTSAVTYTVGNSAVVIVGAIAFQSKNVLITEQPLSGHNGGLSQGQPTFLFGSPSVFLNLLRQANIQVSDATPIPTQLDVYGFNATEGGAIDIGSMPAPSAARPGNYVIRWKGSSKVELRFGRQTWVSGTAANTTAVDGRMVVTPTDFSNGMAFRIYTTSLANPPRDFEVYYEDDEDLVDAGKIWSQELVDRMYELRFGTWRFMDWFSPLHNMTLWSHRKRADYLTWGDYEVGRSDLWAGTSTNSGNDYSVTLSGFTLTHGAMVSLKINAAATGASTLNVSGTGAKSLKRFPSNTSYTDHQPALNANVTYVYDSELDVFIYSDAFIYNGIPVEAIVDLCNEVGVNPWVQTMTLAATPEADWTAYLAAYMREHLNPGIKAELEISNEVWNFWSTKYGGEKAKIYWGDRTDYSGGTTAKYDEWYGKAVALNGRTWARAFGNDRTRFKVHCALWTFNPSGDYDYPGRLESAYYVSEDGGDPAYLWATHYCPATYFRSVHHDAQEEFDLFAEYFDAGTSAERQAAILNEYVTDDQYDITNTNGIRAGRVVWIYINKRYPQCSAYGLEMSAYEGGWSPDATSDAIGGTMDTVTPGVTTVFHFPAAQRMPNPTYDIGKTVYFERFNNGWSSINGTYNNTATHYEILAIDRTARTVTVDIDTSALVGTPSDGALRYRWSKDNVNDFRQESKHATELETVLLWEYNQLAADGHCLAPSCYTMTGDSVWSVIDPALYGTNSTQYEAIVTYNTGELSAPVANFLGIPTSGDAPLLVSFADISSHSPTSWLWESNSGSGWATFSTSQHPTESLTAGTWSIRLTATNATGSDTLTRTDYIVVSGDVPISGGHGKGRKKKRLYTFPDGTIGFATEQEAAAIAAETPRKFGTPKISKAEPIKISQNVEVARQQLSDLLPKVTKSEPARREVTRLIQAIERNQQRIDELEEEEIVMLITLLH